MSEAIRFLHALAQALSAMALYSPGHPAARRAGETAWHALEALLECGPEHNFLFLGGAPIHGGRPLHELTSWPWGGRLAHVGMHRIEFRREATAEGLHELLERIQHRFATGVIPDEELDKPLPGINYGTVAIDEVEDDPDRIADEVATVAGSREQQLDLSDELDAFSFIREQATVGSVARAEVDAVIRLLLGHLEHHAVPQAASPVEPTSYPAVHAINTTLLTMAAGRSAGLERGDLHRLGTAAILHDIGMARIPARLSWADRLSEAERTLVETHPAAGAELLLTAGGRSAELAALVSWEHHLRPDGTGYPDRRFRTTPHWASRLVAVTSIWASLRCPRPYRPAWSPERVIGYLTDGAGKVVDAEAAALLISLVRE
ncbi:MAG: HD domain-containing protein [Gemmatimonadales bacterium]|nr:HD domain-containing protein [Gemmatimonadales bacterium]MDZ4388904.1 HD domain-containing protein [Gemmatimonadales bacterium]